MADSRSVKRALRSLADDPPERRDPPVVTEARAALDAVPEAAAFLADGGRRRLEDAVERAERRGDLETVRAGREALAAFAALRRAVRGATDRRRPGGCDGADHFHSARGTVLRDDGQGSDR